MFDKNSQENIQLMIDLHNDVNEDALLLISHHYLKEVKAVMPEPNKKQVKRLEAFNQNLLEGINYYKELIFFYQKNHLHQMTLLVLFVLQLL